MGNPEIYNRLDRFGLRPIVDAYKQEVRLRYKAEGHDRATARQAAEDAMWTVVGPYVERLEGTEAPQLAGLPANPDSVVDPDYAEPDPGKQLRDGLLWAAFEWMRVVQQTDSGPVANIAAASKPPPNGFALLTLSTYALSDIDRRRELITRALAFTTKSHSDMPTEAASGTQTEGFLHKIGGQPDSDSH